MATVQPIEVPITLVLNVQQPEAVKTVDVMDTAAVNVLKTADERRYTLGVAYPAMKPDIGKAMDGHQDFVGEDVLEQCAWNWLKQYRDVGLFHQDGTSASAEVVESYIWRGPDWTVTSPVDGQDYVVKAGDWMLGSVWTPDGWDLVKQRLVNGYSPQGGARRATPSPDRLAQLRSR